MFLPPFPPALTWLRPVCPARQFGCYREETCSDSPFPPTSGAGTPPEVVSRLVQLPHTLCCSVVCLPLSDCKLLEMSDLSSPVPSVCDSVHICCMNKAVFLLSIYICPFNFSDSSVKCHIFSPLNLILLLSVFSLHGFWVPIVPTGISTLLSSLFLFMFFLCVCVWGGSSSRMAVPWGWIFVSVLFTPVLSALGTVMACTLQAFNKYSLNK